MALESLLSGGLTDLLCCPQNSSRKNILSSKSGKPSWRERNGIAEDLPLRSLADDPKRAAVQPDARIWKDEYAPTVPRKMRASVELGQLPLATLDKHSASQHQPSRKSGSAAPKQLDDSGFVAASRLRLRLRLPLILRGGPPRTTQQDDASAVIVEGQSRPNNPGEQATRPPVLGNALGLIVSRSTSLKLRSRLKGAASGVGGAVTTLPSRKPQHRQHHRSQSHSNATVTQTGRISLCPASEQRGGHSERQDGLAAPSALLWSSPPLPEKVRPLSKSSNTTAPPLVTLTRNTSRPQTSTSYRSARELFLPVDIPSDTSSSTSPPRLYYDPSRRPRMTGAVQQSGRETAHRRPHFASVDRDRGGRGSGRGSAVETYL